MEHERQKSVRQCVERTNMETCKATEMQHSCESARFYFLSLTTIIPLFFITITPHNKKTKGAGSLPPLSHLFLTLLVGNRAGGFAGRLAGCLAFAAAALCRRFLQVRLVQCFNVLHL